MSGRISLAVDDHLTDNAMHTASLILLTLFTTVLLLVLVAFWVPIDYNVSGTYYNADLFRGLAPRALLGTVSRLLYLGPTGYIFIRQLFLVFWLFMIIFQIGKSLGLERQTITSSIFLEFIALSFLFAFNTVAYTTNGLSEFVDVVPYALVAASVPLLIPNNGHIKLTCIAVATVLLLIALLIHEKTIFDIAILTAWSTWKAGFKRTVLLFLPVSLGSVWFLWLVSNKSTSGLSPSDSLELLHSGFAFLLKESLNVWGIILAGGLLWVIFIIVSHQFLQTRARYSVKGFAVIAMMVGICLSTLLFACDTIRAVGLIWLPTFLLIREIDLKSTLERVRFREWAIGACVFQLLLPPVLLFQNGATPFNCYSRELISRFLPRRETIIPVIMSAHDGLIPAVGPFGLYDLGREDISGQIVCWPPRPIRGVGPFEWIREAQYPRQLEKSIFTKDDHTEVGILDGGDLVSSGREGFLHYGPYATMDAGTYDLTIYGSGISIQSTWIDVVSEAGNKSHAKFEVAHDASATLLHQSVTLDRPAYDLEIRVHVGKEDVIRLTGFTLRAVK